MAATGHDGSFLVSEPATCTEDGYEDYYCDTCGELYTIVLPAPGHTWTDGGLVPYCTVCNYGRPGDPIFWSLRNSDLISSVEETYSYVYNGSLLTQMTKGSDTLLFVYDASGTPSELRYNSYYYHYVTNLQGDVVAILDSTGTPVVSYTYNAWGKVLSVTGSMASTLGYLNPLTYRGYVYDWETGLYYLQSRYYSPERGRFINADSFVATGQGILGNNMFAYCNNNPVNCIDPTGHHFLYLAFHFLDTWLSGDGSDVNYEDGSKVSNKLKYSQVGAIALIAIADYKKTGEYEDSGWLEFTPENGGYDRYLSIQHCNYTVEVRRETRERRFLWHTYSEERYVVTVKLTDTYDFDPKPWEGFGNYLNNIACILHAFGVGNDYNWEATIVYEMDWAPY